MLPIMIYIFKEILPQPIELTKPLNKMRDMISIPNKKLLLWKVHQVQPLGRDEGVEEGNFR